MEDELRRVAGIIVGAPLTRQARRDLLYCLIGGVAGYLGFVVMVVLLAFGLTVSASVLGTVIGLLLVTLTLRVSRRIGRLHRFLLRKILHYQVEAPPRFAPGTGLLGRLDRRLRDRVAWRGVWYSLIKLPVAAVQGYAAVFAVCGLIDLSYPLIWPLFHNPASSAGHPLAVLQPLPFRSEEHTSELQSRRDLVCRLLLEKKKKTKTTWPRLLRLWWARGAGGWGEPWRTSCA